MIHELGGWIMGLAGAAMLGSAALCIAPECQAKRVLRLVAGVVVLLALVGIWKDFDFADYSAVIAGIRREADAAAGRFDGVSQRWEADIIREDCAEYILLRARDAGVERVEAETELALADEGFWYPVSAEIRAEATAEQRERLALTIETELGVPRERQIWSAYDEEHDVQP